MVLIRDISVYDDNVPYASYDGLIIRCFNGASKDTKFDLHVAGAEVANKPWWAYSFYNFLYPAAPQVEATINILRNEQFRLPVAFDLEEWAGHKYPPRDELLDNLKVLHDGWYAFDGDHCQFYMNPATIHYLKPIPEWLLACPLWLAHWGVSVPDYEPWSKWLFWQYHGEPDLNAFNGTDAEYWELVGNEVPDYPEMVRTTASSLYVRDAPNGVAKGYVPLGTLLGVNGVGYDSQNRKWWRCGACYVASWYTVDV